LSATIDSFVHRFVPAPENVDDVRTLLLLHGTGGNEDDLIPIGRALDPAAALLSPRGQVLENGMPRFFRRLAQGVFDEEDLVRRTHALADFTEAAVQHYRLTRDKIVAVGYSNGANIAASLLLLRPEVLPAAILFRVMVPLAPKNLPNLSAARVWIGAGNHDVFIPTSQSERLVGLLRSAKADVTLSRINAGHELTNEDIQAARHCLASNNLSSVGMREESQRAPT
jgi:phospholipase/carboxylesterase